jgi:hypothetical protein
MFTHPRPPDLLRVVVQSIPTNRKLVPFDHLMSIDTSVALAPQHYIHIPRADSLLEQRGSTENHNGDNTKSHICRNESFSRMIEPQQLGSSRALPQMMRRAANAPYRMTFRRDWVGVKGAMLLRAARTKTPEGRALARAPAASNSGFSSS